MATVINVNNFTVDEKIKKQLEKLAKPNRNPQKVLVEAFGIWEGRDVSIEKIREQRNRKKW